MPCLVVRCRTVASQHRDIDNGHDELTRGARRGSSNFGPPAVYCSGVGAKMLSQHQEIKSGVGRYVQGFTPMWERTICGFRAGRRGCAASLLCRHINVIKNSDFLSSIVNLEYGPLRCLEAL